MKKSFILFISLFISQISFAQTDSTLDVWGRFTCYLQESADSLNQEKSIVFDVGGPEDGRPLISMLVNGVEKLDSIRQFQFILSPTDSKISGYIVWVDKIESEANSRNMDYNRVLSVARVETIVKVTEGIEIREYVISRASTNVDSESPQSTRASFNYKCLEPELF